MPREEFAAKVRELLLRFVEDLEKVLLEDTPTDQVAPSAPDATTASLVKETPSVGGDPSGAVEDVASSDESSTGEAAPVSHAEALLAEAPAQVNPDGSPVAAPESPVASTEPAPAPSEG